jgi:hypothetical protein
MLSEVRVRITRPVSIRLFSLDVLDGPPIMPRQQFDINVFVGPALVEQYQPRELLAIHRSNRQRLFNLQI